MDLETFNKLSKHQQQIIEALNQTGILSHAHLVDLGYNPRHDLSKLSSMIYQINLKVGEEDKIKTLQRGSSGQRLNPVLIYSRDFVEE